MKPRPEGRVTGKKQAGGRTRKTARAHSEHILPSGLCSSSTRAKKRPCPDCFYCQGCSQDRCRLCRAGKSLARPKLSFEEQIALYERINRKKKA